MVDSVRPCPPRRPEARALAQLSGAHFARFVRFLFFILTLDPPCPPSPLPPRSATPPHPHPPPQVAKTRRILTSPALLESTALIFAHGLDLFCTRVAPSGTFDVLSESFNKAQLVVTVAGLAGAIAVVRPIVGRRKLRGRWYN